MKRDEESDKVHIRATIMVERDSQKGIVIGKGGAMLKKIGTMARKDIELMLGDKVFLETWVKVKKNWRDKKLDWLTLANNKKRILRRGGAVACFLFLVKEELCLNYLRSKQFDEVLKN